jgi:hypothetical protein
MPMDPPSPDEAGVDPFARFRDLLPAGAVPTAVVGTLEYIDGADAERKYLIVHAGDMPMSTFVGLFELGKVRTIEHFEGQDE